jgi:hypothetical protein
VKRASLTALATALVAPAARAAPAQLTGLAAQVADGRGSEQRAVAPRVECDRASPIAHRPSPIAHRSSLIATLQTFGAARRGNICRENEAIDPELDSAQFLSLEVRVRSTRELPISVASPRIAQERVPSSVHHIAVK